MDTTNLLTIPAGLFMPCMTWETESFRLAAIGGDGPQYYASYSVTPFNDQLARHRIYSAQVGETWVQDLDAEIIFYEALGIYRLVAMMKDPETMQTTYLLAASEA
ncbi:MAG: hypothetical protein JWN80_1395 [Microbacteriaceae bacterium]|nr:hypothetical protein [Microbacteriaceae bacterium]